MELNGDLEKLSSVDNAKLGADLHSLLRKDQARRLSRAHELSERRVLVIYTGGTIGMVKTEDGEKCTVVYKILRNDRSIIS